MTIISTSNYLTDLLFTLLYFRRQDNAAVPWWRKALGLGCLVLTMILYPAGIFPFLSGMLQRFLIRIVLVLLFVCFCIPLKFSTAVYAVGYWCTVHLLVQSLFFAPYTYSLFNGTAGFTGDSAKDVLICIALTFLVKCVIFLLFNHVTPLMHISPVQMPDLVPVGLVAAVALYGRELVIPLSHAAVTTGIELSEYYLILQLTLLALLGYMEYTRRFRRENAVMQLQKQEADALLKGIQNQNTNVQAISALRHDLRNHLITLQLLLAEEKQDEANRYISSLLEKTLPLKKTYSTGSDLVDGLLSVKLDAGSIQGIDVAVSLDIRDGSFLSNFDLCILFGNVIDNALEACAALSPEEHPHIHISGGKSANTLLLRFENTCKRKTAILVNGLPLTAKTDAQLHGYGLRNVNAVLKKYDGHLSICQDAPGVFVLTMLIPIP